MAHLLSSERPLAAEHRVNLFQVVTNWLAKRGAARRQRLALSALLDYDTTRLDDLGINRTDLFEALDGGHSRPGARLSQRRAQRSRIWLDP